MFDISIIIATFNRPSLLKRTLNFIDNQQLPKNFKTEVIVIENSEYINSHINFICAEKKYAYYHFLGKGATNARHFGISKSKGDILVIIDDDIRMNGDWLFQLVKPFEHQNIHQVAGRVMLEYESNPSKFVLKNFENYLSKFDNGDKDYLLPPFQSAISCNMAIRRSTFFEVGGLNVCYYGDEKLLYMSGDGECGLSRKLHINNYKIFYSSQAVVYHWVPTERIEKEYFRRRMKNSAIETMYRLYRYNNKLGFFTKTSFHILKSIFKALIIGDSELQRVKGIYLKNLLLQLGRIVSDKRLRYHIRKKSYLN